MHSEAGRAERARELAEWFHAMGGEVGGLMARAALALDDIASDDESDGYDFEPQDVDCAMPQMLPSAANDNAGLSRRRTPH